MDRNAFATDRITVCLLGVEYAEMGAFGADQARNGNANGCGKDPI